MTTATVPEPDWTLAKRLCQAELTDKQGEPIPIPDDEWSRFQAICTATGLDPVRRQIYLRARWLTSAQRYGYHHITSIDGYRLVSERTGQMAGCEPVRYEYDAEGGLVAAWFTLYKMAHGQRCAYTAPAHWAEFKADTNTWKTLGHLMLAKCAEALCRRMAFPAELAGVYTDAEMDRHAPAQPSSAQQRQPTAQQPAQRQNAPAPPAVPKPPAEPTPPAGDNAIIRQKHAIMTAAKGLGFDGPTDTAVWIQELATGAGFDTDTTDGLRSIADTIDLIRRAMDATETDLQGATVHLRDLSKTHGLDARTADGREALRLLTTAHPVAAQPAAAPETPAAEEN